MGDLKEKGLTNEKVARQLFPQDFKKEHGKPESKTRDISRYYKKYKELRDGGYKKMTAP